MSVSFLGAQAVESGGVASSRPRNISSSVSAHTKGSYGTAHFTATAYPASWVLVTIARPNNNVDSLVDIAVGAASSEEVVISNLPYSCNSITSPTASNYLFPLYIPAGSRISSRCQDNSGASDIDVQVTLFAPMFGSERGLGKVETCGAVTASSRGTTIPGHTTTINTKGTWAELIAATSFPYKWICLGFGHTSAAAANTWWTIDIGIGSGGAEVVVVPDIIQHAGSVNDAFSCGGTCFPFSIPAGTRISARCQCSVTTASERDIELVLLGVG